MTSVHKVLLVLATGIAALAMPLPASPDDHMKALPFPADRISLLDGPFREIEHLNTTYLLEVVEPDRLLAGFREQAGLPAKAKRYDGWEARGINGHSLGHYLSALAFTYATTRDPRAQERIRYVVDELAACQEANGDGYVLPVRKRVFEELREGRIRASGFALNDEWVPIYTLHKVFAGLRDAYRLAGSEKALLVERRLADYIAGLYANLTPAQAQDILRSEHGGMNEVFADLTADTGDPRYLELARTIFHHEAILNPLQDGLDKLDGQHGNTQIPKVIGLARLYQLSHDSKALRGASTFWDTVVHNRSFACGGHGCDEHFFPPVKFPERLTPRTAETCNTHNMIRLSGMLFSVDADARRMDFVERGLVNHILANIGQKPGEFGYFLGMGSVGYKIFSTQHSSWWCCVGTGMENPARFGEQVYFHRDTTLWVNLFVASALDWREQGVRLEQHTNFPESDSVRFIVRTSKPIRFDLRLRKPSWCNQPTLAVNGEPVRMPAEGYASIEREWRDGDTVSLKLPMQLRAEPLPHSGGRIVALMYGPIQLAALVPPPDPANNPAALRLDDHLRGSGRSTATPPVLLAPSIEAVLAALAPIQGQFAHFMPKGVMLPGDLKLVPLHQIYEEHYAPYFSWFTSETWAREQDRVRTAQERAARLEALTVDYVMPGFQQSEVEHGFISERSETGDYNNRKWRDALPGGHFSYRLAVRPGRKLHLVTTHFGGDRGRDFDLLIDGKLLVRVTPHEGDGGVFYSQAHPIPAELVEGKETVLFTLAAPRMRAGTFGVRIVEQAAIDEGLIDDSSH